MSNKITAKQQSTLVEFEPDEVWEVSTGKEKFIMNGKQAHALKQATGSGKRGLVWFDDFAVSIAHIVNIKRTKRGQVTIDKKLEDFRAKLAK